MCSLPTRIGSAAHSAWGCVSGEDDGLAWLREAKAGPRLQTMVEADSWCPVR
jgi:hypothetical protein